MKELEDAIDKNLRGIDFGALSNNDDFMTKIGKILSGEYADSYNDIFGAIFSILGGVILDVLPLMILIIAISILSGFVQSLRHESGGDGVRDIIHFVTYSAVVVLVLYAVADLTVDVSKTLSSLKSQMDIIFPILLTLMASLGGVVSVSVYQPAIAMLSWGAMWIFSAVIMPLFVITLVFSVVGNISRTTKYDKFVDFTSSLFKWILGITFTVFFGFLAIQGITAGMHDSISIRATKFTMSSYVPILGGYLSQGFDLILASSMLIKNAVGIAGLFLVFGTVLAPVLKIVVLGLALKLAAAVTQPLGDERISNFLSTITRALSMLVAVLVGAAFMYLLTIGLIIITGNVI